MILPINQLVDNRYIPRRFIASGGMAEIYEANDTYCHKTVAIKIIKEELSDNIFDLERFKNEARYTAMFAHPHIIKIYNIGKYKKQLFISYEIMRGKTLKDYLDERGHLSLEDSLNYTLQLLEATKHIHEREILHNDIKPDNVFLFLDGNIKLIDFGIATHFDEEGDKVNASILYTAPEVLKTGKYSLQSDIYAVGVFLYELLTGKNPFMSNASSEEIIKMRMVNDVPYINTYSHNYEQFDDINFVIQKATNRFVNNRYKSDEEFINDLIKIKNGERLQKRGFLFKIFNR